MRTTSLCLVTSDLVSVLKGNYAGEVGQFVCYTNKAKASVNVYDRFSNTSVLDHARKVSEIKKIVPWDNSCPLPEFFDSILEEEACWVNIKIDHQIAAQLVACGLNHESPLLLNFFRDWLYATQLERTEVSDRVLVDTYVARYGNLFQCMHPHHPNKKYVTPAAPMYTVLISAIPSIA